MAGRDRRRRRRRSAAASLGAALVWAFPTTAPGSAAADDLPVAPIVPVTNDGMRVCLRLATASATVEVDLGSGRVTAFTPADGTNVLAGGPAEAGRPPFGGLWIWPAPEESWPVLRREGAAPERAFESAGWTATAWRTRHGAAMARLTRSLGAPLHVTETRRLRVSPYAATLTVVVRLERTAASSIPLGPALAVRLATPTRLVLPADDRAGPPARPISFDPPPRFAWTMGAGAAVYRLALGGEHRFESVVPARPWLAAELARHLFWLRADAVSSAPPPRVRAYVHRAAGCAELELAADPAPLSPGAAAEWEFAVECVPYVAGLEAGELAVRARLLVGEKEAAAP